MWPVALVSAGCLLASACNDESRLETAVTQAKQMYEQRDPDTGKPPEEFTKKFNRRERKQFTDDMVKVVHSPYREEALYSLGWLGEKKHARVIAPHLGSDDRDTRRVAFDSFSRLVGREFEDPSAARKWWQKEQDAFTASEKGEAFDWFGLAPRKKTPGIP
jgi:hypothetical protein